MDVKACRQLIEGSKILYQQRGGNKEPANEEQVTIDFAFASICTIRAVKKGEVFTEKNIWVKRPGKGGIHAGQYKSVLGKIALRDIKNDEQIKTEDIA
jgi:N-acetylneuraminate synthase